jgi:nucleotide-binding universal stress UspA family protein
MRILLPIDGSECSNRAIESILEMKYPPDTEFRVISIVDFVEPLPSVEGGKEREIEEARKLVNNTVNKLKAALAQGAISGEVLDGYTKERIVETARQWFCDLIVMGSHGRTGASAFLVGSVSKAVLQSAPCTVRIVRASEEVGGQKGVSTVLIPLDTSEHSDHTLKHVLSQLWPTGTKFKCITVLAQDTGDLFDDTTRPTNTAFQKYQEQLRRETSQYLQECADSLNVKFGAGSASFQIFEGDAREKILLEAAQWPANLIVLGSHGRRGIERFLLGSVAETVALHAKCSVEVTRIPEKARSKPIEKMGVIA